MATAVDTAPKGPIRSFYKVHSERAFFTYSPGRSSFQIGRLGVEPSYVEGVLHLRFPTNAPIEAKKVAVRLVGKEQVQWNEAHGQFVIEHLAKNFIIDVEHTLWNTSATSPPTSGAKRSKDLTNYEAITTMDLPFRFALLPELPSTLHIIDSHGRIVYKLIATIYRKSSLLHLRGSEKQVIVRCPLKRHDFLPPPLPANPSWCAYDTSEAVKRGVGYDVTLPTTNFIPGSTVVVPVRLRFYNSRVFLRKISVGIKEYRMLRANKSQLSQKRYVTQIELTRDDVPILEGSVNNECVAMVSLVVPLEKERHGEMIDGKSDKELQRERKQGRRNTCICTITRHEYIRVCHKIKVRIYLGKCEDIKLSSSCVIANFVSEEPPEYLEAIQSDDVAPLPAYTAPSVDLPEVSTGL